MSSSPPARSVIVLIDDLIFETKIRSTAASLGVAAAVVKSVTDLSAALNAEAAALVIVDLNTGGDAIEAIRTSARHATQPRVLAFVSHVDQDLATSAREAGADEVMPRSRFNIELPRLLDSSAT